MEPNNQRDTGRIVRSILVWLAIILVAGFLAGLVYMDHQKKQEDSEQLTQLAKEEKTKRTQQKIKKAAETETETESESEIETETETESETEQITGFYQRLANGKDVNILIVGDSIGYGTGASDNDHAWANLLSAYLQKTYGGKATVTNISLGGNTSYAGYVRTMTLNDGINYDLAIVCYGQNDAEENFSLFYESIIKAIANKYADCSILSILESSQKDYTAKMTEIQKIADHYSIPVVDTIDSFKADYDQLTDDGIHPNDSGHAVYAECVEKIIDEQVASNTETPDYNKDPVNEGVVNFTNCDYVSVDQFEKDGLTYTYKTKTSGIFGIDYSYVSGENYIEVSVDNQVIFAPYMYFDYDFTQRHILTVSRECNIEQEIKIVFSKEEQTAEFYGVAFSHN